MDVIELINKFHSLIGTLVGSGLIAVLVSLFIENKRLVQEKRKSKEREYLAVIDSVYDLREALRNMMTNAQDQAAARRTTTGDLSEAFQLDLDGTSVVNELFRVVRTLELEGDHLQVFGSAKVIAAHGKMMESLWAYLVGVMEGASKHGKILYKDYNQETEVLRSQLDELVSAIRVDLGYGKLSRPRE